MPTKASQIFGPLQVRSELDRTVSFSPRLLRDHLSRPLPPRARHCCNRHEPPPRLPLPFISSPRLPHLPPPPTPRRGHTSPSPRRGSLPPPPSLRSLHENTTILAITSSLSLGFNLSSLPFKFFRNHHHQLLVLLHDHHLTTPANHHALSLLRDQLSLSPSPMNSLNVTISHSLLFRVVVSRSVTRRRK